MENNELNKAKFFAQYWGKTFINGINGHSVLSLIDINDISLGRISGKLLLKPLSSITDEDAIEVAEILGFKEDLIDIDSYDIEITKSDLIRTAKQFCDGLINSINDLHAWDYLRSKGYALPWMGLSVETLVEYGWVKLTDKKT